MIKIDATGANASSLQQNLADVETRLKTLFGEDLALAPETPQGQIAGLLAELLTETGEAIVEDANASDLDHAGGVLLDSLGSLLAVTRRSSSYSRVTATVTGEAGAGLPAGSRAKTQAGDEFESQADAILGPSGVSVEFQAISPGAVAAAAGELNRIVTVVPGWETITNANPATEGVSEQEDADYRAGYMARTARVSVGSLSALKAAMFEALATRVRIEENNTDSEITVQGWVIPPHSFLALVQGGSDADIARAVENHRGMGVGTITAISGGAPDNSALDAVNDGTVNFNGEDDTGLDLTSAGTSALKAAALTTLLSGVTVITEWPSDEYYVAIYAYVPGSTDEARFGTDSVEDAFGLDPDHAVASPGPFVRPRERELTVTVAVTRRAGFPADGLAQLRTSVNDRVKEYGIGEQVWLNDLLCAFEAVPGTRVTSISVQEGSRDISGVMIPLDVIWALPAANLTINLS